MPREFSSRASPGCFSLASPSCSVPRARCSILHLCPPSAHSSRGLRHLWDPFPRLLRRKKSHKKTHGIFLIALIAQQVETCGQGGKRGSWEHPALLSVPRAAPEQTLPRTLLPAANKSHPKNTCQQQPWAGCPTWRQTGLSPLG